MTINLSYTSIYPAVNLDSENVIRKYTYMQNRNSCSINCEISTVNFDSCYVFPFIYEL